MADPQLMLTPLRSGSAFKRATASGRWEPMSGTLGELGDALDASDAADVDVVRSTPDPWAQARSFADAMTGARQDVPTIRQWRGLLALLALSDFYAPNYRIEFTAVDIASSTTRFAGVMRRLLPKASLPVPGELSDASWERPWLLQVLPAGRVGSATVVGMLNPASLVAGARDLGQIRLPSVPWALDGMEDPTVLTGRDALPPAALGILSAYVLRLKDTVATLCGSAGIEAEQSQLAGLLRQLDGYAKDCDATSAAGGQAKKFPLSAPEVSRGDLPALYTTLTSIQKALEPEAGTSDCMLGLRDDLLGDLPIRGLVLLDPAIASPDRPANGVTFWGLRTLQSVLSAGDDALATLRAGMAEQGYLIVHPEDLLSPVLVQLDEPDRPARIDAHPDVLRDFLLPVSPLALLLRSPEKLRDGFSLGRDGRAGFDVLLSGRPHRVSRRYAERPAPNEGRLVREVDWGLGDVALWPDFTSDRWSTYCARIDYPTNGLGRIRGRFATSGRLVAAMLAAESVPAAAVPFWGASKLLDPRTGAATADPVPAYAGRGMRSRELDRFRASASGGRTSEVQISRLPFEAVFYALAADPDQPPVAAGCALLRISVVTASEQHERDAHVAVDFGTTNTVACLGDVDPIRLAGRIVHPIASAGRGGAKAVELSQKLRDFLPPDDRTLPTPSVIIARPVDAEARDALAADGALEDAVLIRHLMYFQPDFAEDGTIAAVPLREWSALLNSIRYDLKWSRDREMRDAARRFLRQLMMMISAEWARNGGDPARLAWHFSRPRDMGDDREFKEQIAQALRDVIPDAADSAVRPLTYEGDAAAAYILDERSKGSGTRGALNVILDIGGGTTDVAVWTGGAEPRQILSASLRIAGGDFFTDHIMANPQILGDFGLKSWADVVRQLRGERDASLRDNIRYIGELLFSGRTLDSAIERSWSRVSGTDDVRSLKETSFLFLGGVAWFVGRHLRELIRAGVVERSALQDVAIAFCGRGSGLFRRLHGADPRARTEVSRLLLLMAAAAGSPSRTSRRCRSRLIRRSRSRPE